LSPPRWPRCAAREARPFRLRRQPRPQPDRRGHAPPPRRRPLPGLQRRHPPRRRPARFHRQRPARVLYPADGLFPKHVDTFADEEFDYLVVLCDTVRAEDPPLPRAKKRLDWPIEDPGNAKKRGLTIEEAVRENRAELRSRIVLFLEDEGS
jgi:hypothetical protein